MMETGQEPTACVYLMNRFLSMSTGSKIQVLLKYLTNSRDFSLFASISYIVPHRLLLLTLQISCQVAIFLIYQVLVFDYELIAIIISIEYHMNPFHSTRQICIFVNVELETLP